MIRRQHGGIGGARFIAVDRVRQPDNCRHRLGD